MPLLLIPTQKPLNAKQKPVQSSPDYKSPVCPMPGTTKDKSCQNVDITAKPAFSVTPNGIYT